VPLALPLPAPGTSALASPYSETREVFYLKIIEYRFQDPTTTELTASALENFIHSTQTVSASRIELARDCAKIITEKKRTQKNQI
jgi:hypothetical protein